nr:MAG TPA_asm: hypothetical protein [Caudoviricetes sp.]
MRIDELKKIAKGYSYKYSESKYDHIFTKPYSNNSISIDKTQKEKILIKIPILCEKRDFDMLKAAMEFAETDPEDREEENKFWIQHKFMVSKNLLPVNLVWNKLKDVYRSINLKVDNHIYQAQFTFKEYEGIKKKLNTDLADFELVEVEE